jgi:hypothetical protein
MLTWRNLTDKRQDPTLMLRVRKGPQKANRKRLNTMPQQVNDLSPCMVFI